MSGKSLQQDNTLKNFVHNSEVMNDLAAFPKDRSIDTASGKRVNISLIIDNLHFPALTRSAIDIVSFASLFIFSRLHNLERISTWRGKIDTNAIGELLSATFPPHATLIQAFNSFTVDRAPSPRELKFAIGQNNHPLEIETFLAFDSVDSGLRLTLTAIRGQISALSARDFLEKISLVVTALAENPHVSCSELSLVTDAARSLMPDLTRAIEVKPFEPVPHLFLRTANEYANQAAISANDERYSYAELARLVRHIATQLTAAGVRPGDIVAVSGFMSMGTVAAMIATMAAGGVMVTVDHALPEERQKLILDISRPRFLINVRPHGEHACSSEHEIDVSDWLSHAEVAALPDCAFTPPSLPQDAPAYVFFTSGSSGVPKGVLGAHLGLAHFLDWQRRNFPIGPGDRAAQITALSFDVVLRDVLFPLTSGACLYFLDRAHLLDARRFLRWSSEKKITAMHCVPSLMKAWLKGADDQRHFDSLKVVFFAGEPLNHDLLDKFIGQASKNTTIVNLYGPTETTLAKLSFKATRVEPGVQPVGAPQPGVDVAIFRDRRSLCGLWEIGEIAIRTPYRSKGYLANEDLTRKFFLPNPLTDDVSDLIYFTGDLGRVRSDGLVEIFGRIDSQIKIRGVRIEPNEIEGHILGLPGIQDAAVAVHKAGNDEKVLTALVVCDHPLPRDQHLEFGRSIREALKTALVDAMVPSRIIVLESLPYLPTGKLDRQSLARTCQAQLDTEAASPEAASPEAAAETPEGRLLDAFRMQLRSQTATLDSSFESLGGDSLSYVTVYLAIEDIIGEPPPQWTSMSVRELGGQARKPGGGLFTKIDSAMLFRALSICAVVADHFQLVKFPGVTGTLMYVSGLMFGNIQAKEIARLNSTSPILRFTKRFLIQYFALVMPNVVKTFMHGAPPWAALFLIADIVDWRSGLASNVEMYWYIHCVLHITLIFAAIYVIAKKFCIGKHAVFITLSACCGIGLIGRDVAPYLMDSAFHSMDAISSDHWKYSLFYYSPMIHIGTFAIAALSTMVTGVRKLLLSGVFICYSLASLGGQGEFATASLLVGGLWIMFAPKVPVPRLIVPVVYNVAGASLFIYLLHLNFLHFTEHWSIRPPVALVWAGAIAVGVAAWRLWNLGEQILPRMLSRIGAWRKFRGGLNVAMASRTGSAPPPPL